MNHIPKNVLSLENMLNLYTKFKRHANPKTNSSTMMHSLVNLGTLEQPKYVNLGTFYSYDEKHTFIQLFKMYCDVFSWDNDDLNTYET
jgi:hypothetical protein